MSHVIAFGAVSSLGRGRAAFAVPDVGEVAPSCFAPVPAYEAAGVRRSTAALIALSPADRALDAGPVLLDLALTDCLAALDVARPQWRTERVGLVIGTSSGGVDASTQVFRALAAGRPPPRAAVAACTYASGFSQAAASLGVPLAREASVLVACASSTIALGLAHLWTATDACDVVLAGGYDGLSLFVSSGFSSLAAVTATQPRPFRAGRDGLALGEGAAMVAIVRHPAGARSFFRIAGFGLSSDAVHVTAPDRHGAGLARAAARALAQAGLTAAQVDLVSAHGTATPYNDAAEASALASLGAAGVAVHAPKGALGHTLGAAGVLESLAAADAMERGIHPATAGNGDIDPEARVRLVERSTAQPIRSALKLSAAFGGANAALVLLPGADLDEASTEGRVPVHDRQVQGIVNLLVGPRILGPAVHVDEVPSADDVVALTGAPLQKVAKLDDLARLVVAAVALLTRDHEPGWLDDKALVVQTAWATLAANQRYFLRVIERGAALAEPRRFPATSPNLAAGEASILLGIRGPVLTLGGSADLPDQATAVARDLLDAGAADAVIVVQVEEASAPAALVAAHLGLAAPRSRATARMLSRYR